MEIPEPVGEEHQELVDLLLAHNQMKEDAAFHEATILLSSPRSLKEFHGSIAQLILDQVAQDYERLRHAWL